MKPLVNNTPLRTAQLRNMLHPGWDQIRPRRRAWFDPFMFIFIAVFGPAKITNTKRKSHAAH